MFDRLSSKNAVKFFRELYGYKDRSNNGKYTYHRKGLLDDIPHVKLVRGVIITTHDNLNKITEFIEKLKVEYHVRAVILTEEDRKILSE